MIELEDPYEALAKRLRDRREELRISQADLVTRMEPFGVQVSASSLRNWETAKAQPKLREIRAWALALGMDAQVSIADVLRSMGSEVLVMNDKQVSDLSERMQGLVSLAQMLSDDDFAVVERVATALVFHPVHVAPEPMAEMMTLTMEEIERQTLYEMLHGTQSPLADWPAARRRLLRARLAEQKKRDDESG